MSKESITIDQAKAIAEKQRKCDCCIYEVRYSDVASAVRRPISPATVFFSKA